jgi:hypothetical protein
MAESSTHTFAPRRLTKAELAARKKAMEAGRKQLEMIAELEKLDKAQKKEDDIDLSLFTV